MALAARSTQTSEGADQAFAANCEVVKRGWVVRLAIEVVGQWVLVPRLPESVLLAVRHALYGSSCV